MNRRRFAIAGLFVASCLLLPQSPAPASIPVPSSSESVTIPTVHLEYVEYFFDTDPGPGNGFVLNILWDTPGHFAYTQNLLVLGLSYGEHVMCVRYRDTNDRYSGAKGHRFYVAAEPNIVSVEECVDSDPSPGSGQSHDIDDGSETVGTHQFTHSLPHGVAHVFYQRLVTEDGSYSAPKGRRMNVSSGRTFTDAEYFLDPDPGPGNGTSIDLTDASGECVDFRSASVPGGSPAERVFSLRCRTSSGYWSVPTRRLINLLPPSSTDSIHIGGAEAFIDVDPGVGNGSPLAAEDGQFDELDEGASADLSVDRLEWGVHDLCVRFRDASNRWTNEVCGSFAIPVRAVIDGRASGNPNVPDIFLAWQQDPGATSYQIHFDSVATGSFTGFTTVTAPETSVLFPLDTLSLTRYYYVLPVAPPGIRHGLPKTTTENKNRIQ